MNVVHDFELVDTSDMLQPQTPSGYALVSVTQQLKDGETTGEYFVYSDDGSVAVQGALPKPSYLSRLGAQWIVRLPEKPMVVVATMFKVGPFVCQQRWAQPHQTFGGDALTLSFGGNIPEPYGVVSVQNNYMLMEG